MEDIKALIKREIESAVKAFGLEIDRVILFGSRARGDSSEDSDWDILIILSSDVPLDTKKGLFREIKRRLSKLLIPCDVLIRTFEEAERLKSYVSSVTRVALEEGITL